MGYGKCNSGKHKGKYVAQARIRCDWDEATKKFYQKKGQGNVC